MNAAIIKRGWLHVLAIDPRIIYDEGGWRTERGNPVVKLALAASKRDIYRLAKEVDKLNATAKAATKEANDGY